MKRFLVRHAKSSALLTTLAIHAGLIVFAVGFVAFAVTIERKDPFQGIQVDRVRPRMPSRPPRPFHSDRKKPPKPQFQPIAVKPKKVEPTDFVIPPVAMINLPMRGERVPEGTGIGCNFETEMTFFDSESKGEKVCFIVHFGPATIGDNPYSRMTGYVIRKRLEEIVERLPAYTLFNVACYWAGDTCAMSPDMLPASPENKQLMKEWMAPVNPLEGSYDHCFDWQDAAGRVESARNQWPTRVENLPFYSPKWVYPYQTSAETDRQYLGETTRYVHWGRGVAWSVLTQKPDTIFVLTTNYIDGWGNGGNGAPSKMAAAYKQMFTDIYGRNQKDWPTLNVVVLSNAGKDVERANDVLSSQFGPLVKAFNGDGSVIADIADYMNGEEKALLRKYAAEHGKRGD